MEGNSMYDQSLWQMLLHMSVEEFHLWVKSMINYTTKVIGKH